MKKSKNVLHTGIRDIIVSINTEILGKPWKSIKVTPFHGNCFQGHQS